MKSWLIFHAFYDIGQNPEEFILQLFPSSDKNKEFLYGREKNPTYLFLFDSLLIFQCTEQRILI